MIFLILAGFFFAILVALGTGGGMLLIPVLTEIFLYNAVEAKSIVLLLYVPISLLVSYFNIKNGFFIIPFKEFALFIVMGCVGVFAGNYISNHVDYGTVKLFYAVLIIGVGVWQITSTLFISKDNCDLISDG